MEGFVKLHRDIQNWEWYKNSDVKSVFIHLLVSANYKDSRFEGLVIKRGQVITGVKSMSEKLGMHESMIRRCMDKLELTKELVRKPTNKFTIITICNYEDYQGVNSETDNQSTNERQSIDKRATNNRQSIDNQSTTSKKGKKDKKEKNKKELFEMFWDLYNKKKGRFEAEKSWHRLDKETLESVIKCVPAYRKANSRENYRYLPNPATFLNQKRWLDVEESDSVDDNMVDVIVIDTGEDDRIPPDVLKAYPTVYKAK